MKTNLYEKKMDLEVQIKRRVNMNKTVLINFSSFGCFTITYNCDQEKAFRYRKIIENEMEKLKADDDVIKCLRRIYLSIPEVESIDTRDKILDNLERRIIIDKTSHFKVLINLSGGLDSTTLLYYLINKGAEVHAISFDYGSKHNSIEIEHAKKVCDKLDIPHQIIHLDFINKCFKSDLLQNGGEIPEGHYTAENMKSTVVPFRNGIFYSISAGLAESYDCDFIALASHAGDHAIYPDCRGEFTQAMFYSIKLGTEKGIQLIAPFNKISKDEIVKIGQKLGVDFSLTYSCYKGKEKHCGKCGTCVERKEAFEKANVLDPTTYEG